MNIHDKDLQQWFSACAKIEWINNFKASKKFLNSFKQEFGISGQKRRKLITENTIQNFEPRETNAIELVQKITERIKKNPQ